MHVGTDVQVIVNYVDDSIRDIGNATALSSALDEFSFCPKDANAALNSTPSRFTTQKKLFFC
jgi:hypothetical protein